MAHPSTVWRVRTVEWGILALVLLGFVGVFGYYAKRVHSQAERAAVLSTLGALRTALVVGSLPALKAGKPVKVVVPFVNPFDALAQYPASYAGVVTGRDVSAIAQGQWVFDAQCDCIGYKPLYLEWLTSQDRLEALWFQRRTQGGASLLVPLDRYVWDDQLVE